MIKKSNIESNSRECSIFIRPANIRKPGFWEIRSLFPHYPVIVKIIKLDLAYQDGGNNCLWNKSYCDYFISSSHVEFYIKDKKLSETKKWDKAGR